MYVRLCVCAKERVMCVITHACVHVRVCVCVRHTCVCVRAACVCVRAACVCVRWGERTAL